jgi:hypothetical protein
MYIYINCLAMEKLNNNAVITDALNLLQSECKKLGFDENDVELIMASNRKQLEMCLVSKILKGYTNITITDDMHKIMHEKYTAEMYKTCLGFKNNANNMCAFVSENAEHPVFQAIFSHAPQQLIFKYSGDDHKQLEKELLEIYPKSSTCYSFNNVIISTMFDNYHDAYDEFQKTKKILSPDISKQCHTIELQKIGDTGKLGILWRIEPKPSHGDMLSIVVNYTDNATVFNGNVNGGVNQIGGNANVINIAPKTQKETHRDWIHANVPYKNEKARAYYNRAKDGLGETLTERQHGMLTKSLGFVSVRKSHGNIWTGKCN